MKVFAVMMSLFVMVSQASAAPKCPERLRAAKAGQEMKVKVTQEIYTFAAKALKHYRSKVNAESEYPAYIESVTKHKVNGFAGPVTLGYEINITDGGDESTVTYTYGAGGKLIQGYLHNQSPETYWFCEK